MKNLHLLFSDTKEFLSDSVNRLGILVLLLCAISIYGFYTIENQLIKCTKTVNARYFNLTRSLEGIYNIEIDTKDGRLRINPHTANSQQKL